jgi:acetyl-CoA C-acetyltransferase
VSALGTFHPRDAVVVAAVRTPIGRAGKGSLAGVRPDDMLGGVIAELLAPLEGVEVDEVVCGCGYPWGEQGYNVGRTATLLSGLPDTTPACTVSRMCASSLEAIRIAGHTIACGEADAIVAGGVESVSRVGRDSHLAEFNPRLDGSRPGAVAEMSLPMVETAERVARRFDVAREEMDAYAQRSQERAVAAREAGFFAGEIRPVPLPGGGVLAEDEGPRPGSTLEGLAALEPITGADGVVTAGNACPLNDGAAAVLVMSAERCRDLGLRARARIVASAVTALDPSIMGVGPIAAVRTVLQRAGLTLADVDQIELNEAFASQVIASAHGIGLDPADERLNAFGGAIALGHPFGMTGARLMCTLLSALEARDGEIGVETMCVGGGQGQAMVVQRLG